MKKLQSIFKENFSIFGVKIFELIKLAVSNRIFSPEHCKPSTDF